MLRVSLLLATASIALYFAGGPNVLLEAKTTANHLVSSVSTTNLITLILRSSCS